MDGSNDPDVYFVSNAGKPQYRESIVKFTEFIIADYNNFVEAAQKFEEPWKMVGIAIKKSILNKLNKTFDFNAQIFYLPVSYDLYCFNFGNIDSSCFEILRILFMKCMVEDDRIYAFDGNELYLYKPHNDVYYDRKINYFEKRICFISRDWNWGWIIDDQRKVYVFGDSFRTMIKENQMKMGLEILLIDSY